MRTAIALGSFVVACNLVALPALADPAADKAVNLVKKAVKLCKESGKEKAFATFQDPKGGFVDGEYYLFAYDFNGVNKAHGGKPDMVGKNLLDLKDPDGKMMIKEMIEVAKAKGSGWVDYKFKNPETGEIQQKASYVEKVDGYLVGCGVYKK